MHRRIALAAAALIAATSLLSACATAPRTPTEPPGAVPQPTATTVHGDAGAGAPPPFQIRYDESELILAPSSWCYRNGCADGLDMDPPSVGSPEELLVFLPVAGFTHLSASQVSGERFACDSRTLDAEVEEVGDGWWRVRPLGPADDYTLDLFATGDGAGDMAASLRWTTTSDGPLPEASSSLVLIVDHDGAPDSYGLEFSVRDLAETPTEYAATITVTAANGKSLTLDAVPADFCSGAGSIFFDGPDEPGVAAAALGDFPFRYDVELVLDGETYTATAEYSGAEEDLAVPLEFTPALP